MIRYLFLFLTTVMAGISADAQTVVISNTPVPPVDPVSMLEIRKPAVAKINVRSANFIDTAWIQLSNRNSIAEGTDFNIVAARESGLFFNTRSDIPGLVNDSLFTMLRNGSIGIGTKVPTAKLDLVGSIRMRDGNEAEGRTLRSDANGVASWAPKTFGFAATGSFPAISNRQSIPTGISTAVTALNLEEYDPTFMYNAATGVVTIAETGVYHVDVSVNYAQSSSGNYSLSLVTGAGTVKRHSSGKAYSATFTDNLQLTISADISMTAGQTLRVLTEQNSGATQFVWGGIFSWFNMHKLY